MDNNHKQLPIRFLPKVEGVLQKIAEKDPALHNRIENTFDRISLAPLLGKPLRYNLKNQRRVHVGSFVLVYKIADKEILIVDFDHHDRIYKK